MTSTPLQNFKWSNVLARLETSMAQTVFDTWLKNSQATFMDNVLIVHPANSQGHAWLENRLHAEIARSVKKELNKEIEIRYAMKEDEQLELDINIQGIREGDYNQIVRPDRVFVGTQYFRQVWVPTLGPDLAWMIMELRQRCYWDKKTNEKRTTCQASYKELGAAAAVSERTAFRKLAPSPLTDAFIKSRFTIKGFSPQGKIINLTTQWNVKLDEPILDLDIHILP